MMKKAIMLSILVMFWVSVVPAAAQCPTKKKCGCVSALAMTPEQETKFSTIREAYQKEILPIRNELEKKVLELRVLLAQPSVDAAKAKSKQQEIFGLQKDLQERSMTHYLKAREILTSQQVSMLPPGCCLGFKIYTCCGQGKGCGGVVSGKCKSRCKKSCPRGQR